LRQKERMQEADEKKEQAINQGPKMREKRDFVFI
jgi:hypothetical protein